MVEATEDGISNPNGIPKLGLGTYGRIGEAGIRALQTAIEIGYRHFDTAQSYDTERPVGEAIRRSGLKREAVFITTKVADTRLDKASFLPSVEASLDAIGLGPVDLLLIHWPSEKDRVPFANYVEALAEARSRGMTRLIGVSNFPIALLDRAEALLGRGAIATDQVELNPFLQAPRLAAHARHLGIPLTAYLPLARGAVEQDETLIDIAARHDVRPSAVALAFLMAEGHIVIPASSREANLRANFAATGVRLSEAEIAAIRRLDQGRRQINPDKAPRWDD
jgi:2,5-diketo-D-gluconate reductase B